MRWILVRTGQNAGKMADLFVSKSLIPLQPVYGTGPSAAMANGRSHKFQRIDLQVLSIGAKGLTSIQSDMAIIEKTSILLDLAGIVYVGLHGRSRCSTWRNGRSILFCSETLYLQGVRGPDDFDLVVTDMTMPKLTGDNLAKELKQVRPDIPIILCTGFNSTMLSHNVAKTGISRILRKPIIVSDFAKTVRETLDSDRERR